jgi:hypothetical protein
MADHANPLLDFSGLPRFDEIRAEHVGPAIDTLLVQAEAAVKQAETVAPVSWESFVEPLDDATENCGAHGGRWVTCKRWSTPRRCARPTTPACRRSAAFPVRSARIWRCTRSTRR